MTLTIVDLLAITAAQLAVGYLYTRMIWTDCQGWYNNTSARLIEIRGAQDR